MAGRPPLRPIKRLLIANRGEIAARIISTASEQGLETFALYTTDDASHTLNAAHAIQLPSAASYLDIAHLIQVVQEHRIDAIHPGYGFLSESADFSYRMWNEAEAIVIGPGWDVLRRTGDKLEARKLAEACDVPVLPATREPTASIDAVRAFANEVGFPVIAKAVDGGGGRGIRIIRSDDELDNLTERARRESPSGQVFVEKAAIDGFRHVEVQVVGDGFGESRHLWERECSVQRRFQKVVEFAPSSIRDRELVARVIEAAERMAREVAYMSLGTFEFLVRESPPEFFFLEVNPRLQVEHTVTESICLGLDLVKVQLQIAAGKKLAEVIHLPDDPEFPPPIHSIQLRITAEDASHDWALSVGKISALQLPSGSGVRVDTHMLASPSTIVKTDFDSLLAKLIVTANSWEDAVARARRALSETRIEGVKTSLDALRGILASDDFLHNKCDTQWLEKSISAVLKSGAQISADLSARALIQTAAKTAAPSGASSSSSVLFRKGDAWSVTLAPTDDTGKPLKNDGASAAAAAAGHLQLTRVLRNEFPSSLSASILYTPPSGAAVPLSITMATTTASAGAIASTSKHRKGDAANANHVVIPFPGQLMEVLVDEGDVLRKGDVVAVVRQMKMELEVRAAKGGTVGWVTDAEDGEDVGEGLLVCELLEEGEKRAKL